MSVGGGFGGLEKLRGGGVEIEYAILEFPKQINTNFGQNV